MKHCATRPESFVFCNVFFLTVMARDHINILQVRNITPVATTETRSQREIQKTYIKQRVTFYN